MNSRGGRKMKLSFIGCGNMGSAMLKGILAKGIVAKEDIIVSEIAQETLKSTCDELGVYGTVDNKEAVRSSDIIVLAVKPQYYEAVIEAIRDEVDESQIIVSIAPGKTLAWLEDTFGKSVKVVRTMPNTPALVQAGMTGVCANDKVSQAEFEQVLRLLVGFGEVEEVEEHLMDVVTAVSGSSPAYIFMLIEAMADAAVAGGMPRAQAYRFASQAVLGSAKLVLETGRHPGELKDMVCSPGGTTIEAVRVLEEKGMRSSIIEAMKACVNKAKGL